MACVQVVAFQAMMEMMAQQFPGAFSGYNLAVTESHQRTKADTSGTAKAVVGSLQRLGLDFSEVSKFCVIAFSIACSMLLLPPRASRAIFCESCTWKLYSHGELYAAHCGAYLAAYVQLSAASLR